MNGEKWIYIFFIDEKVEYFEKYGVYRRFFYYKKCNN